MNNIKNYIKENEVNIIAMIIAFLVALLSTIEIWSNLGFTLYSNILLTIFSVSPFMILLISSIIDIKKYKND